MLPNDPSEVFKFVVAGERLERMAAPGQRRWFLVHRETSIAEPAVMQQFLTYTEAKAAFNNLSLNPKAVSAAFWEQNCLEVWRK